MLGLFMILPVFSTEAQIYDGVTIPLIGIAIGIYGLTQALFQLPFGMLSDRIGRKPVIAIGLSLFILGSFCAAESHHIVGVIVGRALQGAGAVGSTILAAVADLTREENRSRMMGVMGLVIGVSFALAMILGPWLNAWVGMSGMFIAMAILALIGLWLLWLGVPPGHNKGAIHTSAKIAFKVILQDKSLLRLNASIFLLHAMLTALFVVAPIVLTHELHLHSNQQMLLYLAILLLAFIGMMPFLILAEKKQKIKPFFVGSVLGLAIIQILLSVYYVNLWSTIVLLLFFFMAFSFLEALLPSWVSKITPVANKGSALGVFSSAQFLGIFVGGSLGGWCFNHWGLLSVFWLGAVLALIWLWIICYQQNPIRATLIAPSLGKE